MLRQAGGAPDAGRGLARRRRSAGAGVAFATPPPGHGGCVRRGDRFRGHGLFRRRRGSRDRRHRTARRRCLEPAPDQPDRVVARRGRHRGQGRLPAGLRAPPGAARAPSDRGPAGVAGTARAAAAASLRRDRRRGGRRRHAVRRRRSRGGAGVRRRARRQPHDAAGHAGRRTGHGRGRPPPAFRGGLLVLHSGRPRGPAAIACAARPSEQARGGQRDDGEHDHHRRLAGPVPSRATP